MEQIKELGEKTVRAICHDDIVLTELRGVLYHDYHTFARSANVAFYCVLLARSLGITSYDDLTAIATGGLLHDAGKLDIPADILTKPSPAAFPTTSGRSCAGIRRPDSKALSSTRNSLE